ncbi:hypothetical protein K458DRAFT_396312 [Lentithecium fluviatile CBS 122367]|uniref:Uncharacterized protein n=1 Tax=Lentithecium fluviatile CBS 122367 TaxID=1168545 RepID=A0A6G1IGG8_9PLEO|nr:hypothetical protein K458DRAFT_396312 [Lentithecium fluviatile CBS 122367]
MAELEQRDQSSKLEGRERFSLWNGFSVQDGSISVPAMFMVSNERKCTQPLRQPKAPYQPDHSSVPGPQSLTQLKRECPDPGGYLRRAYDSILSEPIKVVKDLEEHSGVDESTFVIYMKDTRGLCQDRKALVYDILAESVKRSKWPAAILGRAVFKSREEAKDERDGHKGRKMLATPQVVEMLGQYTCLGFDMIKVDKKFTDEIGAPNSWDMNLSSFHFAVRFNAKSLDIPAHHYSFNNISDSWSPKLSAMRFVTQKDNRCDGNGWNDMDEDRIKDIKRRCERVDSFYKFLESLGGGTMYTPAIVETVAGHRAAYDECFFLNRGASRGKVSPTRSLVLPDIFGRKRLVWLMPEVGSEFTNEYEHGLEIHWNGYDNLAHSEPLGDDWGIWEEDGDCVYRSPPATGMDENGRM